MNEILFHYEKIDPTTWVYLASLLIIGLFFKFGRFWSVRNLDLVLLILLAPGLLLVSEGQDAQRDAMAAIAAARKRRATRRANRQRTRSAPRIRTARPATKSDTDSAGKRAAGSPDARQQASATAMRRRRAVTQRRSLRARPTANCTGTRTSCSTAETIERIGFIWLLLAGALLLIRLLIDPTMVRRPLLEPNMTTGGLTFSCCSLFVFLMANVVASRPRRMTWRDRPVPSG